MLRESEKSALKSTKCKIFYIGIILGFIFISFSAYLTHQYMRKTKDQRLLYLKQSVQMARNSIEPILIEYRNQNISMGNALNQIRGHIRRMVYDDHTGKNYIFMSSYDGIMLVQPFEPEKEMTDMWNLEDYYGVYIIRGLVKAAKSEEGQGYLVYHYQRPGQTVVQEKISFVIGIPELGCYIGTGQYMGDLHKSQIAYTMKISGLTLFLLIFLFLLVRVSMRGIQTQNTMLKKAENELAAIFHNTFQFIGTLSVEGELTKVNRPALDFIEQDESSVIGKPFWELPWWQDDDIKTRLKKAVQDCTKGEFSRFEVTHTRPNRDIYFIDFSLTPIFDEKKEIISLLAEGRDMTERQMVKKALKINEERYRELFNNMTSGVVVYTVKEAGEVFLIKDLNRAAEQITKVKKEDVFGENAVIVFPGLAKAGMIDAFRQVCDTGHTTHIPAVLYRGDHLSVWVEHNIYKLPSGEIVSVFNDITDEKQTLEKLQAEREKIESVINGIGDSLYIINQDYKVEFQNDLSRKIFGNLVGNICYKSIFNQGEPCEFCLMRESLAENKIKRADTGIIMQKNFEITFSPFQEALGDRKTVEVLRDVTDKKNLAAEALRAGHLASLGELAAGVAHEINNPVTGIISIAEILTDKFEQLGGDRKIPERIIHEGERISRIVKSLLSFARVKNDAPGFVGINQVLKMTLELVEKQLFKDGIHLFLDLLPDLPQIRANDQEIQQVFLNIISNARYSLNQKYPNTDDNKKFEISTRIITEDQTEYVRTVFLDSGLGIPGKALNSITDPFFSTKPPGEGTGLGLSISHGIIKAHGGRLLFKSMEGEYARVIVDLPVEPVHASDKGRPVVPEGI